MKNEQRTRTKIAELLNEWSERGSFNPDDMSEVIIDYLSKDRNTKDLMDHEIATMINELTSTAQDYCHAQCLRGELRKVIVKHLEPKTN